ncbi:PREDICTED: uncharacterized protein LOC105366116 [Ceratosolen solmsi marchali]|uniref:Uncharacterized protein LOC105366116 n=1 Tax=Ceratosolen solmsi marchali TaxID=326594 RepID=A0AAJ6YR60_9HYME|nr:PREDICTED: uncharacterized protein LOC105366116 [Ceratosolen solmsi marchali]
MDNLSENYIQIPSHCNPILKNATNQNELSNIDLNTVSCNFLSKSKHFIPRKSNQEEFLESNNDSQLNSPSQINQHLIQSSQKQNFTIEDSYTVDNCTDDNYIKKESCSQLERKDSYDFMPHGNFSKPSLRITESYYIKDHKQATCNQNITIPQPISRGESYQRGYFKNQQLIDDTEITFGNAVIGEYKTINETLDRYERGEETIKGIRDNSLIESHLSDSSKGMKIQILTIF